MYIYIFFTFYKGAIEFYMYIHKHLATDFGRGTTFTLYKGAIEYFKWIMRKINILALKVLYKPQK